MLSNLLQLDGNILLFIQEYIRTPYLNPIFQYITSLGDRGTVWILLSVGLLCFKRTRKVGIVALFTLLFSYLIDNVFLKNIFARTRPYEVIDGLHILIRKPLNFSFPSGHTGSSFAAAVVFCKFLPKKYGIPALTLAVLIGFSRLYLGVHYPSDVIGGALIGTLIAFGGCKLYEFISQIGKTRLFEHVK